MIDTFYLYSQIFKTILWGAIFYGLLCGFQITVWSHLGLSVILSLFYSALTNISYNTRKD